jgi:hypothetical protein
MPPSDEDRPEERPGGAVLSPARPARAQRPPADLTHQHRATAALFLAMLSLFGLLAISNFGRGIYIVAFALLAGVLATWFAATAIGRARHHGTALPRGAITALVVSSLGMAISMILLAGFAVLGKQLTSYSHCLTAANTVAAQQTCQHQFTSSVTGQLNGLQTVSHR